ncbi:MAG: two component transcriptional regulator, LuxR family [Bacteroidetes bacterium]|nr:two component transcriptional regulator, LuxR family [Bacteroidota bacterium]
MHPDAMTKTTQVSSDDEGKEEYHDKVSSAPPPSAFSRVHPMADINVIIIEDNQYVREAWGAVVASDPRMELVGSYGSCEEAFSDKEVERVEIALMDIGLPGMSGIEGIEGLKVRHPKALVIMCTVFEDDNNIFNALCAGAVGYILKKTPPEEILRAINDAAAGGSPMTPAIARKVIKSFHLKSGRHSRDLEPLTEREQQVLDRLVQGKSYSAIADEIFISVDGVRYHLRHIYEKLQVSNRAEAVAKGLKERLVPPPR